MEVQNLNLTPEQMLQVNTATTASLSGNSVSIETLERGKWADRLMAYGLAFYIVSAPVHVNAISESLPNAIQFESISAQPELLGGLIPDSKTLFTLLGARTLEQRFREQADKWARETQHLSSPTQKMMHPSYEAIMGMAQANKREIIRLLLLDLKQHRNEWFWALSYLTQENPIEPADAGKMDRMIAAWVNWGRAEHII